MDAFALLAYSCSGAEGSFCLLITILWVQTTPHNWLEDGAPFEAGPRFPSEVPEMPAVDPALLASTQGPPVPAGCAVCLYCGARKLTTQMLSVLQSTLQL